MITIDSYTKFTESLKETGVLSKDFHIIQYSEGCCLGVDGKSKEFEDEALENADYILWDKFGIAYRTLDNERPGVVIGEDGVSIQQVLSWSHILHSIILKQYMIPMRLSSDI